MFKAICLKSPTDTVYCEYLHFENYCIVPNTLILKIRWLESLIFPAIYVHDLPLFSSL